jgi:hypothetical protein
VPNNQFSFDQSHAMRQAVESVLSRLGSVDNFRTRIAVTKMVLDISIDRRQYDAEKLAAFAMEKLRETT